MTEPSHHIFVSLVHSTWFTMYLASILWVNEWAGFCLPFQDIPVMFPRSKKCAFSESANLWVCFYFLDLDLHLGLSLFFIIFKHFWTIWDLGQFCIVLCLCSLPFSFPMHQKLKYPVSRTFAAIYLLYSPGHSTVSDMEVLTTGLRWIMLSASVHSNLVEL